MRRGSDMLRRNFCSVSERVSAFDPKLTFRACKLFALPIGRHVTFSRQLIHRPPIVELAVGQLSPDKLVNE